MKCACIYVDVDSYAEFYSDKIQTARTQHKCSECGRVIALGEKYEYVSGCWKGFFSVYKTCWDCLSIRREFFCDDWNFEMVMEDLHEYVSSENGEVSESCILELTAGAREKVFEAIEQVWED